MTVTNVPAVELVPLVIAATCGLVVGSFCNRLILREPGYVIRDPGDLPAGADRALLDELEPVPEVGDAPILALVQPRRWSPRWLPVTEGVTAALFALTVHRLGAGPTGLTVLVLVTGLVALAGVDARVFRLPDALLAPTIAVALPAIALTSLYNDTPAAIVGALVGGVTYFGLLFFIHLVSPRGMGFGDVKLAFLMGCYLGWLGGQYGPFGDLAVEAMGFVLIGAMAGSVLGLVVGVAYAAARRSLRAVFPFGPSLAIGCLVVVLWSAELH